MLPVLPAERVKEKLHGRGGKGDERWKEVEREGNYRCQFVVLHFDQSSVLFLVQASNESCRAQRNYPKCPKMIYDV